MDQNQLVALASTNAAETRQSEVSNDLLAQRA